MYKRQLTERGLEQALALACNPALVQCMLLVVSPLSRAIQTAAAIFGEEPGCRTCLCALHTERRNGAAACNKGSARTALATRFPFVRAWEGFAELAEEWWPSVAADGDDGWRNIRVPALVTWLREQPERKVVVVGHGVSAARAARRAAYV